jgi:hypothetical protein
MRMLACQLDTSQVSTKLVNIVRVARLRILSLGVKRIRCQRILFLIEQRKSRASESALHWISLRDERAGLVARQSTLLDLLHQVLPSTVGSVLL